MLTLTKLCFLLQVFEHLAGFLSELDVLLSFADLASSCPTPYTRPRITPPVNIYIYFLFLSSGMVIFYFMFRKVHSFTLWLF